MDCFFSKRIAAMVSDHGPKNKKGGSFVPPFVSMQAERYKIVRLSLRGLYLGSLIKIEERSSISNELVSKFRTRELIMVMKSLLNTGITTASSMMS